MSGQNKKISFFSNKQANGGQAENASAAQTGKESPQAVNAGNSANAGSMASGQELIAVFAAAIAEFECAGARPFRVVSFKRTGQTSPVWNLRGRSDYLYGKL